MKSKVEIRNNIVNILNECNGTSSGANRIVDYVYAAMKEYASQQAPASTPPVSKMEDGWVKVQDGYPTPADGDKDGNVLGWDKFQNKYHKCSIIDIAQMKLRFTHWSTLPPPPSK